MKIIGKEYQALKNVNLSEIDKKQYKSLYDELKSINKKLWDIENEKRLCEKNLISERNLFKFQGMFIL